MYEGEQDSTRSTKLARLTVREEMLADRDGHLPVARATFPLDADGRTLREDLDAPELGLPRDLDGDGVIDSEDHSGDFRILPVVLELEWVSPSGPQTLRMSTVLRRP
jgi:hypothetical protein